MIIIGKKFIYQGLESEKLDTFTSRIMSKFPNARLLPYSESVSLGITNSDKQSLY